LPRSTELLNYSLALYRETRDRRYIASAANSLGRVLQRQGDQDRAWQLLKESLLLRKDLGDRQGFAESLETVAGLLLETEGPAAALRAGRLLGAAHGLRQAIGAPVPSVEQPGYEQLLATARRLSAAPAGPDGFQAAWDSGLALAGGAPDKLLEQALAPASRAP
jgi:hypothetical protein